MAWQQHVGVLEGRGGCLQLSQSLRSAFIKQRKVSSGYFSNSQVRLELKELLFKISGKALAILQGTTVGIREADDTRVIWVWVFKC